jgi:Ca-activated chloride channel family protein
MSLAHPLLALLALPAAAAAWWAWRGLERRRPALSFPMDDPSLLAGRGPRQKAARWLPWSLQTAALLLLCLALARPQKAASLQRGLGLGIDIMLAIDTSLSMNAVDFEPNRLEAAKATAKRFVSGRAQDRIGLVTFGGGTMLACPLTLDFGALLGRIEDLQAGMAGSEGTALGEGIISAVNHLRDSEAKSRVIILLTDGRGNVGIDALTGAKAAQAFAVKIYAIGTAKKGETMIPVDDPAMGRTMVPLGEDLDEETLSEVARLTEGKYFRATNLRELKSVYDEIDRLERSSVRLPENVARTDLYHLPVLAAVLLLLLEAALSQTVLLRWP